MNILHVEDEVDYFERVIKSRLEDDGRNTVFYAGDRESAEAILHRENIDYLIADLAVPSAPGEASEYENGVALVRKARQSFPGMPILILTGQQTEEAAQELEDQQTTIFWDGEQRDLIRLRPKRHVVKAIQLILDAANHLRALEDFELSIAGDLDNLDRYEKRIFRLFAKSFGENSAAVNIGLIGSGLSGARVFSVCVLAVNGEVIIKVISKIGSSPEIDQEVQNSKCLSRLPVGSVPTLVNSIYAGCRDKKGVFFQFATEHSKSYFEILRNHGDNDSSDIVRRLRELLAPWTANKAAKKISVRELRAELLSDDKFNQLSQFFDDIQVNSFEERLVTVNFCTVHGDLHGQNVLVSSALEPVLIDYGDIKDSAPVLVDPVCLMLSPYFHPVLKYEHMECSDDLADKLIGFSVEYFGASFASTSKEIRSWVEERAQFKREYYATVYSYAVRQLSYVGEGDVNVDLAIALIRKAIEAFEK